MKRQPAGAPKQKAQIIVDPLPSDITVTISDTGHGMTPNEIAKRFLPLNRNRRRNAKGAETKVHTEAGKRFVMGRKGIGKLSAFGAAEKVTITSKRAGQPFWTKITMVASELLGAKSLAQVPIRHEYVNATLRDRRKHGTIVELSGLRCDSVGFTVDELKAILNETFYPIKTEEFGIRLNGETLQKEAPELAYWWPEDIPKDGYATDKLADEDWGEIDLKYRVQFRTKSLPAEKRGAYIYAKQRLAMEPSMLGLNTGMHNFMAHAYMECIVESDDIDSLNIDVIGTNRSGIIQNSDLVRAFLDRVTELMTKAMWGNAAFREKKADEIIDTNAKAKAVRDILSAVPPGQRRAARQIARIFVAQYGVESPEFEEVAPLIIGTANAGQVLVDLIRVSNSPTSVREIASALVHLREIERTDALKLYQARRNGIIGLRNLIGQGEGNWNKGPQTEKELHRLLKKDAWLIRPELADYVASDVTIDEVLDRLAKELEIDAYAPTPEALDIEAVRRAKDPDDAEIRATTRPDLVALIGNAAHPTRVLVIELKSTALPLRIEHWNQLQRYMRKIEQYFRREYPRSQHRVLVEGVLIGAMPDVKTNSDPQLDLLKQIEKRGINENWEVIGLNELLRRTEQVHRDMIAALKAEDEEDKLAALPAPAATAVPAVSPVPPRGGGRPPEPRVRVRHSQSAGR
jgi:hypothetical protein